MVVRRTGGLAGITKEVTVRLDQVPEAERESWLSLLDTERLAGWSAAGRAVPDAFQWSVRCPERGVGVTLDESALPGDIRTLLERALD